MRPVSFSFLTGHGASPEEAIEIASATGYDYVGLRLLPAAPGGLAFPLMDEPMRLRAVRSRLNDSGMKVFDVEMIRIGPSFDPTSYVPFFAAAQELGARSILVAGDDPDEGRLTNSFVDLCEAAAPFDLSMDLEFMPQSDLKNLSAALRVLEAAKQPNQGVIVDSLHVSRAGVTPAEIAAIPREWMNYAQICDGPADIPTTRDELNYAARHQRLLPGDGGIDLASVFASLPDDLPVAVEIPNDAQAQTMSRKEWAALARERSLDILGSKSLEVVR